MLSTHGDHYHQLSRHFVSILKHVNLEKSKNMPPPPTKFKIPIRCSGCINAKKQVMLLSGCQLK